MAEDVDYSHSRWVFCKQALRGHARLWVIAAFSFVFFAGDFSEKFIKPRVESAEWSAHWEWLTVIGSWPTCVWAFVVLLILLGGTLESSFRLYRAARKRSDEAIAAFENYRTKQLELMWNPEEEPYRWWDMGQKPAPVLYFRLRVKNISGSTVNGIKVELSELIPRELICVPCPIRLMNNILPRDAPEREFSLNPGDKRFIDLMLQSRSMDTFWILHTVQGISEAVPKKSYRMVIRISAINVPEIVRPYELIEDGEMWRLQEATNK